LKHENRLKNLNWRIWLIYSTLSLSVKIPLFSRFFIPSHAFFTFFPNLEKSPAFAYGFSHQPRCATDILPFVAEITKK